MHESKNITLKWPFHAVEKLQNVINSQQQVYELSEILLPVKVVNKSVAVLKVLLDFNEQELEYNLVLPKLIAML